MSEKETNKTENSIPTQQETSGTDQQDGKQKKNRFKKENKETVYQDKINELNDKYLRLFAEFDNYRKRALKEKIELGKYAGEEVILSLLPVVDDFDRAMKSFDKVSDLAAMKEGITLINNKLKNILENKGLQAMETLGKEFCTDFHEAITNIPAPTEDLKGKVVDEIEKGYELNGKVIRFAKVVVGS
jgi:molecular chaperone GrpE